MSVRDVVQAAAGVGGAKLYVEDVFSTYLYTGNGSTQTITNGIDLAGEGGLVWIKARTTDGSAPYANVFTDTERGAGRAISSGGGTYGTAPEYITTTSNADLYSFNSDGFTLGVDQYYYKNNSPYIYTSWTFRKAPKFFDVVTYTGDGVAGRTIAHNLGSVPGCIIVKITSQTGNWAVYHRSLPNTDYLLLNTTDAAGASPLWNNTSPTDSAFTVGSSLTVNGSGRTYVAYLFAHDAGGFGDDGLQDVISCGSYTGNGSATGPTITLGWEPQYVMVKQSSSTGSWYIFDSMRGFTAVGSVDKFLRAEDSAAEDGSLDYIAPTATGFQVMGTGGHTNAAQTYIYIAIRRPMKTPASGSEVFAPIVSASAVGTSTTTNFPVDLQIFTATDVADNRSVVDRLRGVNTSAALSSLPRLNTINTNAEASSTLYSNNWGNSGFGMPGANAGVSSVYWNFKRAPGFFDVVCFSTPATVSAPITVNHNLGVAPELIITKRRNSTSQWFTVCSYGMTASQYVALESSGQSVPYGGGGTSTWSADATTVTLPSGYFYTSSNYVYYLFASCPGVSKVGSYTGNGTSQTINCGFSAGARFVLIKRTDSTGDWYVWDSVRGIIASNDPHLSLNTNVAQVTTDDSVDADATGFIVNQVAATNVNVSSATYIFLSIA